MSAPNRTTTRDPQDRRIRRSWRLLVAGFLLLCLIAAVRAAAGGAQPSDLLFAGLVLVVGAAAIRYRDAVGALESGRRAEAESFARILQGLSRSVSPDAIVEAIVQEVAVGTGADHVVVVRRRPASRILEAVLVSSRPGVPSSTTLLPISDLEDPPELPVVARQPVAVGVASPAAAVAASPAGAPSGWQSASGPIVRRARELARRAGAIDVPPAESGGIERRGRLAPAAIVAERIARRVRDVYGLKHTLTAPLRSEDELVGAIVVSRRTAEPWPASAQRILGGAAIEASAALSRAYSHREAETRASTDALTGLPNRRYFDEFCGLLARRRRAEDAVGVLMVDIDRFKQVNDVHGHGVGDEVLRAVARAITSAVREDDVPARFGGEEFAVLLRNPTREIAIEVGERVRGAVAALDLRRLGVAAVSVSVGVAVARRADQPVAALVAEADAALYDAKRAGRDRVVAAA